jgi:argininosuccinate synthase
MKPVSGSVKLKLFKGSSWAVSRISPNSLYREDLATFGASGAAYDHADAGGFIKLFGLPVRAQAASAAERARTNGSHDAAQAAVDELIKRVGAGAL